MQKLKIDSAQLLYTIQHRYDYIIYPSNLEKIITAQMLSTGREETNQRAAISAPGAWLSRSSRLDACVVSLCGVL